MTQQENIAVIGIAGQRDPIMERAAQMGFTPHAFSWESGTGEKTDECSIGIFHAIAMQDTKRILEVCKELDICAIVPVGSDMAAKSAATIAAALGLSGSNPAAVAKATDKIATRNAFAAAGLPQPAYVEILSTIPESLKTLDLPCVVKPCDRSGGRGVVKIDAASNLYSAIDRARDISNRGAAIVEEYVPGAFFSCECISFNGDHAVVAITRRHIREVDGAFCEAWYQLPAGLSARVEAEMRALARRALDALEITCGATSVEMFLSPDGSLLLNEVTPTMYGDYVGSMLVSLSTGCDYSRLALDAALGNVPQLPTEMLHEWAEAHFVYGEDDLSALRSASLGEVVFSTCDKTPGVLSHSTERHGSYVLHRVRKVYGGAPPLVLPEAKGLPTHLANVPSENIIAFNSEIAAFRFAISQVGAGRIHIPWYAAPAWEKAALACDVKVKRYHIGRDFHPLDLDPGSEDAVLLPNYHAQCGRWISQHAADFSSCIIDNSQAFYAPPVLAENVYNVYSPRKFFALPDGGLLVSASIDGSDERPNSDLSYKRARTLLMSLELGEEAPYKERMANEQELIANAAGMSKLTHRIFLCIDHIAERRQREMNYKVLSAALADVQGLTLSERQGTVPQFYPLMVAGDIRDELIERKVFVPLMWRHLLEQRFDGTFEGDLARHLVCLPIDQRYTVEDMEYIANIVLSL